MTDSVLDWDIELVKRAEAESESLKANLSSGVKFAIWGTSGNYRKYYRGWLSSLPDNSGMEGFVDNNSEIWGQSLDNYEIHPPKWLHEKEIETIILATTAKYDVFKQAAGIIPERTDLLAAIYKQHISGIEMDRLAQANFERKLYYGRTPNVKGLREVSP